MFVRISIILLSILLICRFMKDDEPRDEFSEIIHPSPQEICHMCMNVCRSSREGNNSYFCYFDICKCNEITGEEKKIVGEMPHGLEEIEETDPVEAQSVPAGPSDRTRKSTSLL